MSGVFVLEVDCQGFLSSGDPEDKARTRWCDVYDIGNFDDAGGEYFCAVAQAYRPVAMQLQYRYSDWYYEKEMAAKAEGRVFAGWPEYLEEADDEMERWLVHLSEPELAELRNAMNDWLQWEADSAEASSFDNPNGSARWVYECFHNQSWLHELGIVVVEGLIPCDDFCALELTISVEEANLRAEKLGLPCRFK